MGYQCNTGTCALRGEEQETRDQTVLQMCLLLAYLGAYSSHEW